MTAELRRLLALGTGPRPWRAAASGDILTAGREWIVANVNGQDPYGSGGLSIAEDDANAALIVAAVNVLPDLLAVIDAAQFRASVTFVDLDPQPEGPDLLEAIGAYMDRQDDAYEERCAERGDLDSVANREVQADVRRWASVLRAALDKLEPTP
jgi:hypothetical protein